MTFDNVEARTSCGILSLIFVMKCMFYFFLVFSSIVTHLQFSIRFQHRKPVLTKKTLTTSGVVIDKATLRSLLTSLQYQKSVNYAWLLMEHQLGLVAALVLVWEDLKQTLGRSCFKVIPLLREVP